MGQTDLYRYKVSGIARTLQSCLLSPSCFVLGRPAPSGSCANALLLPVQSNARTKPTLNRAPSYPAPSSSRALRD